MCTFAGDGERTTTGAAEGQPPTATPDGPGYNTMDAAASSSRGQLDLSTVRTRNDLAMLINEEHQIKQEITEEQGGEVQDMDVEGQDMV